MKHAAKKTGFVMYGKYSDLVEYEYRGYKYEIECSKCMNYMGESCKHAHAIKQEEIDRKIELANKEPQRSIEESQEINAREMEEINKLIDSWDNY